MKEIPKHVHIIWIGGDVPARNRKCIETFPVKNPDWKVNLWIDRDQLLTGYRRSTAAAHYKAKNQSDKVSAQQWSKVATRVGATATDEETIAYLSTKFQKTRSELRDIWWDNYISIRDFCKAAKLSLRFVSELGGAKNMPIYRQEMVSRGTNFGAASDVLRIEILNAFGGVYFDTDVICLHPLGTIKAASHCRWSAVAPQWASKGSSVSDAQWNDDNWWKAFGSPPAISNSIIAAHPKSSGLQHYRKIVGKNYKNMFASADLQGEYVSNIRKSTIQMTGPTAATRASGFGSTVEKVQSKQLKLGSKDKTGQVASDFLLEQILDMRDNWYFPMYKVSDQYFHDWL